MGRGLLHRWILALCIVVSQHIIAQNTDGEFTSLIEYNEITESTLQPSGIRQFFSRFGFINGKDIPFVARNLDNSRSWSVRQKRKRAKEMKRKFKRKKNIKSKNKIKFKNRKKKFKKREKKKNRKNNKLKNRKKKFKKRKRKKSRKNNKLKNRKKKKMKNRNKKKKCKKCKRKKKGVSLRDKLKYDTSCQCGMSTESRNRVVNGVESSPHKWPWMVTLEDEYGSMYFCGGSIISDKYILTAAHCIFDPKNLYVRIGDHDKNSDEEVTELIQAKKVHVHPNYGSNKFPAMSYDFAVIRLKKKITFSKYKGKVSPVCLARKGDDYSNSKVTVAGWGTTSSGGLQATVLMEADLETLTNEVCSGTTYNYGKNVIDDSMICAVGANKDSCQGDSGGPLFTYDKERKRYLQVGVVSWGNGCAEKRYPGVYSRVTLLEKWILKRARKSKFCSEGD